MAIYMIRDVPSPILCFTGQEAGTIALKTSGNPSSVSLEYSTDGITRSSFTIGSSYGLGVGSKLYLRNTSTTNTTFSSGPNSYYYFQMSGKIAASGDLNYLINKNSTTVCSDNCFARLFQNCTSLTSAPSLPATTVGTYSYYCLFMYSGIVNSPELPATTLGFACYSSILSACSNLTSIPKLIATNILNYSYQAMFNGCPKVKFSTTKTGIYQNAYRMPVSGTGTAESNSFASMFASTGGTTTADPTVNTTYYTSNTIV